MDDHASPKGCPQNVAIFASQIFTAIVGISYLSSQGWSGLEVTIISVKHPSYRRHHELITSLLIPQLSFIGYSCTVSFLEELPKDSASPDLLITPRIDHRLSLICIDKVKPKSIVEIGESIGVEPKLYSYRYRFRRYLAIQAVRRLPFVRSISYSHMISTSSSNHHMLASATRICDVLKRAGLQHQNLFHSLDFPERGNLNVLLLPFLALPENKEVLTKLVFRARKRLGILGRYSRTYLPHPVLKVAAKTVSVGSFLVNCSTSPILYVKAHPKNQKNIDLILASLAKMLGVRSTIELRSFPPDLPLEEIIISVSAKSSTDRLQVLGFGTNLLSAMLFLYPDLDRVTLLHPAPSDFPPVFSMGYEFVFNRKELLRRRHVSSLIASLRSALLTLLEDEQRAQPITARRP